MPGAEALTKIWPSSTAMVSVPPRWGNTLAVGVARHGSRGWRAVGADGVERGAGVFVDGGDDPTQRRIGGEAVRLAGDVPLSDDVSVQTQFDDGTVQVAIGARLALGTDTILETDEEPPLSPRRVMSSGLLKLSV